MYAIGITGCEAVFWPQAIRESLLPTLAPFAQLISPQGLAVSLLCLAVINVGSAHRLIRRKSVFHRQVRPWALGLRLLLSAPPLLSFAVLAGWRWIEEKHPAWIVNRPGRETPGAPAARPASVRAPFPWHRVLALRAITALLRRTDDSWLPDLLVLVPNYLWIFGAALWVGFSGPREPVAWGVALAGAGAFRLMGLTATLVARSDPTHLRPTVQRHAWLELLWLLPTPVPQLWVFFSRLATGRRRDRTLVYAACVSRGFLGALDGWVGLQQLLRKARSRGSLWLRLRKPSGLRRSQPLDESDRGFFAVARSKVSCLYVDGLAVGFALWVVGQPPEPRGGLLPGAFWVVLLTAIAILGLTIVAKLVHLVAWRLWWERILETLDAAPYLRLVALGQISFLIGFLAATGWSAGGRPAFTLMLALATALAVILVAGGLMIDVEGIAGWKRRDPGDRWFWVAVFVLSPAVLFLLLVLAGGPQATARRFLSVGVAASLASGLWVTLRGARWLLHPFSLRDLTARDREPRLRRRLAFLVVSSLLPLGGLVAPAWLRLHRWLQAQDLASRGADGQS